MIWRNPAPNRASIPKTAAMSLRRLERDGVDALDRRPAVREPDANTVGQNDDDRDHEEPGDRGIDIVVDDHSPRVADRLDRRRERVAVDRVAEEAGVREEPQLRV